MKRLARALGVLALLFLLLVVSGASEVSRAMISCLPLGWWSFLSRNIPQLTWNLNLFIMGLVCSVVVIVLAHWLLQHVFACATRDETSGSQPKRWRWRWTVYGYCTLWLLFLIAFGATGVFRQTSWLMKAQHPWYNERLNYYVELRFADTAIYEALLVSDRDVEKTLKELRSNQTWHLRHRPFLESFDVVLYANSSNLVEAYVLIPREPRFAEKGFQVSLSQGESMHKSTSELQKTLLELDLKYGTGK